MTDTSKPQTKPIPIEYSGLVIAWDSVERNRIVATGKDYDEAHEKALAAGAKLPLLQSVPRHDRIFIGAA